MRLMGLRGASAATALEAELGRARDENRQLRQENRRLQEEIGEVREENGRLREELSALRGAFSGLQEELQKLKARLTANSRNSSKPPSSDGPEVPPRPRRRRRGSQRGGQPGHTGTTRSTPTFEEATETHHVRPEECEHCGAPLWGDDPHPVGRAVIEIPKPTFRIIWYWLHSRRCKRCGRETRAKAPETVGDSLFGQGIHALGALLAGRFRLSKRLVSEMFETVYGLSISPGTICAMERRVSAALEEPVEEARAYLRQAEVMHADETSWRMAKLKAWLWTAATEQVVSYWTDRHRNSEVVKRMLGEAFDGIVVVDRWSAYLHLRRAYCWAHLLRDFKAMSERYNSRWHGRHLEVCAREILALWTRWRDGEISRDELLAQTRPLRERMDSDFAENGAPNCSGGGGADGAWARARGGGILARMETQLTLEHERVDDVPVILGMAKAMGIPEALDRHLGNHGLQAGLSNGGLASVWVAYILSEGDHRKSALEPWIKSRQGVLASLMGQMPAAAEGNDDRLGRLLRRLRDDGAWGAIEAELWRGAVMVLGPVEDAEVARVHLDSTTSYGYHTPGEDGLMQLGHSKDHRPDLAQFKVMAAVAAPGRQMLAADVVAGQRADDGLYLPLIRRVRAILGRRGLLYVGDAKMAARDTRAAIAAGDDFYLTVLPRRAITPEITAWLRQAYAAQADCLEHSRTLSADPNGQRVTWQERVILQRSDAWRARLNAELDDRLARARQRMLDLTPEPGRGKRLFTDVDKLSRAIGQIEHEENVQGLVWVTWRHEPHPSPRDAGRRRLVVTAVLDQDAAIARRRAAFGWRVLVTNAPADHLAAEQALAVYNQAWTIEQQFHNLKDRPLGIQPLCVSRDDQIIGLTRLLILALRLLTLIEVKARNGLARAGASLAGLYDGQPKRTTDRPTGKRLLTAFYKAQITFTRIRGPAGTQSHITPLSPLLCSILDLLNLPHSIYSDLARLPAK